MHIVKEYWVFESTYLRRGSARRVGGLAWWGLVGAWKRLLGGRAFDRAGAVANSAARRGARGYLEPQSVESEGDAASVFLGEETLRASPREGAANSPLNDTGSFTRGRAVDRHTASSFPEPTFPRVSRVSSSFPPRDWERRPPRRLRNDPTCHPPPRLRASSGRS